jgi:hypothetical protein
MNALFGKNVRNRAVADRLARFLRFHQLLDERADRGGRAGSAVGRADVAGEEVFQLEDAARRKHVLVGGHARDGGFVHADNLGDIVQYQRFHRLGAVLEEGALPVDDGARHFEQGLVTADQALDEPACFLQFVLQIFVVGGIGTTTNELLVLVIDAEARGGAGGEVGAPYAADFFDRNVRCDVAGMTRGDTAAGARVEKAAYCV